jgi:hypothetical protein
VIECPEKALYSQISHKINNICSTKYYSNYFDSRKNLNEKKTDTLKENETSKKSNCGSSSLESASEDQSKQNKKDAQKKVIFILFSD